MTTHVSGIAWNPATGEKQKFSGTTAMSIEEFMGLMAQAPDVEDKAEVVEPIAESAAAPEVTEETDEDGASGSDAA